MIKAVLAACLSFAAPRAVAADFQVPALTGAVVDDARMFSRDAQNALEGALRKLWNTGNSQIAVLTVEDTGGLAIEQASIKVVDEWKLGTAKGDNGVLVMISKADRAARIEVGQGLEGNLPDAYAKRIIDGILVPHFKAGNYDEGILKTVAAIAQKTDPGVELDFASGFGGARPRRVSNGFPLIIFVIIMLATILPRMLGWSPGIRSRRGYWSSGSWSGGSGFGGGSGGFGGGGGGFSGGGASGKW